MSENHGVQKQNNGLKQVNPLFNLFKESILNNLKYPSIYVFLSKKFQEVSPINLIQVIISTFGIISREISVKEFKRWLVLRLQIREIQILLRKIFPTNNLSKLTCEIFIHFWDITSMKDLSGLTIFCIPYNCRQKINGITHMDHNPSRTSSSTKGMQSLLPRHGISFITGISKEYISSSRKLRQSWEDLATPSVNLITLRHSNNNDSNEKHDDKAGQKRKKNRQRFVLVDVINLLTFYKTHRKRLGRQILAGSKRFWIYLKLKENIPRLAFTA